jgi:hypothetical protein
LRYHRQLQHSHEWYDDDEPDDGYGWRPQHGRAAAVRAAAAAGPYGQQQAAVGSAPSSYDDHYYRGDAHYAARQYNNHVAAVDAFSGRRPHQQQHSAHAQFGMDEDFHDLRHRYGEDY